MYLVSDFVIYFCITTLFLVSKEYFKMLTAFNSFFAKSPFDKWMLQIGLPPPQSITTLCRHEAFFFQPFAFNKMFFLALRNGNVIHPGGGSGLAGPAVRIGVANSPKNDINKLSINFEKPHSFYCVIILSTCLL